MRIKLENIGMIKEADVKLNGLTVIAGENDTGKSTLGKILFATVKADNIHRRITTNKPPKEVLATWLNLVFDGNITKNGNMSLIEEKTNEEIFHLEITDNNYVKNFHYRNNHAERPFFDATFIQSPIVFDMVDFFDGVAKLKEMQKMEIGASYGVDFDFSYPIVLWDIYTKISNKNPFPKATNFSDISTIIQETIGGEFKKENQKFGFNKYLIGKALKIELANTAFGIKSFGLLQLLNENGYLNKKYLLVLDEPEVHLHPQWQLKYAKIIIELVKNGIFVIVNTHSPYMLQALKFYSDKTDISKEMTSFYLADKKYGESFSTLHNKTDDLNAIFQKLTEPLQEIVWAR